MPIPTAARVSISDLHRADGSATYSHNGYKVLGAVNGPVEVMRRDELPDDAAIDVIVRPVAGISGVKEKHLETIIQSTLRHIILTHLHPRTLIQVTLQILATPEDDRKKSWNLQGSSYVPLLPPLLQTTILALMSASIPLGATLTSTLCAVMKSGVVVDSPSVADLGVASSIHALAFSSKGGRMLVNESEGAFDIAEWVHVFEHCKRRCQHDRSTSGSQDVSTTHAETLEDSLRAAVEEKLNQQMWTK